MTLRTYTLEQLLELMKKFDLSELSISRGRFSLHAKKGLPLLPAPLESPGSHLPRETGEKKVAVPTPPVAEPVPAPAPGWHEVKAPLVGTFYRRPAPEAEPFVEVGDQVQSGDTLCIIEAMKTMNEIQTDIGGTVRDICVKNAELVQFDQVLFRIEPGP